MKIVVERFFEGANPYLPVSSLVFVLAAAASERFPDSAGLARMARAINLAMRPIENPFEPIRLDEGQAPEAAGLEPTAKRIAELVRVLLRQFGCTAARSTVRPLAEAGHVAIACETRYPFFGRSAARSALKLFEAALEPGENRPAALAALVEELNASATRQLPSIETRLLLEEADRRGIPWFRLAENIPIVQLGQGFRRKRFRNSMTDRTGDNAYRIASFKPLAAHVLQQVGIPMPRQDTAETEDAAVAVANRLGYPVVVKPVGQDMGVGVRIGIANESELRAAFRDSRRHGPLQVETHLQGLDHRFTFMQGRLVSVLRTSPPALRGDGRRTVRELLAAKPAKTATLAAREIIVDDEVRERIRAAGYGMDDILPAEKTIQLRRWWRNRFDHVLENVTEQAHPENVDIALLAAETIGLDLAGVDYITTDITRPYYETGGAITEVNPMPALAGVQRSGTAAYPMLLEAMFPGRETGRVPVAAMLGERGAAGIAAAVERLLTLAGHRPGIAAESRQAVGGRPVRRGAVSQFERMRSVLRHPRATAALVQMSAGMVVDHGLGLERCDVGIVLLPDAEPGQVPSSCSARESEGAAVLLAAAERSIVIDIDDPRAALAIAGDGETPIFWIAIDSSASTRVPRRPHDVIVSLAEQNGAPAVTIDGGGAMRRLGLPPGLSPALGWRQREACRSLLVAIAAVHGLGTDLPADIAALADFPAMA